MKKDTKNLPIFIIGTGRSGTNWLGNILLEHPEIRATIEKEPMFSWSVEMALNPSAEGRLLEKLIKEYKQLLESSVPRHYLDKNHPNIWIADKIKGALPEARFLGIVRNPYATVASMMAHRGVADWHRRWREFPMPNRFLGISGYLGHDYDALSLATQCAMRWNSHHQRMCELVQILGKSIRVTKYEELASSPEEVISGLGAFLGLQEPIKLPDVQKESLYKWRSNLTTSDIRDIHLVTGMPPDEVTEH